MYWLLDQLVQTLKIFQNLLAVLPGIETHCFGTFNHIFELNVANRMSPSSFEMRMSRIAERRVIFDLSGHPVQKTGLQLDRHERLLQHFVFAAYDKTCGGRETEAWVVPRVPQHHKGAATKFPALLFGY
jgi:hypothetical protein